MITLALAQVVYFICLQAQFTGGENGLQGIPRGTLFGAIGPWQRSDDVLLRAGGLCRCVRLHSPHRALTVRPGAQAIRANEPRAISLGYKVDRYKAHGLRAVGEFCRFGRLSQRPWCWVFATLSDVSQGTSGEVILMTLLGGSGTFLGPVVGANVVVTLQEYCIRRGRRLGFGDHCAIFVCA